MVVIREKAWRHWKNMEIEQALQQKDETVREWLRRLDGEPRRKREEEQKIAPEIYEEPRVLFDKRKSGGVDVNEILAWALEEDGVANEVVGQLFDTRRPEVGGRQLVRVMSEKRDKTRLSSVLEALLLGMGPVSKTVIREVCPVDKRGRRQRPTATPEFTELPGGNRSSVVDRVVARLTPKTKVELVQHQLGEVIYTLQAPMRKRIREMVREQNDPFLIGR